MHIREVEGNDTHSINFYEFIDVEERTITSFFQAVKKPNISLGAYEMIFEA